MAGREVISIEAGSKRVFATAIRWPGWCRSGADEDMALEALIAYGPRYATVVEGMKPAFAPPSDASKLEVVERAEGNATTDFGAPGVAMASDERPLGGAELGRLTHLLEACWTAFDAAAETHLEVELRKGPRGGGRDVPAMIAHVREAEQAYLYRIAGAFKPPKDAAEATVLAGVRSAMLDALAARARGDVVEMGRRTAPLWVPRYCIRRSAWHALDHAWEIEDRASPA
jgi:hypothetical protein